MRAIGSIFWLCVTCLLGLCNGQVYNYSFIPVYPGNANFPAVAMNASGSFIAAANSNGGIWISQDGGESYTPSGAPQGSWQAIATNYAGQYLVAVQEYGYFYLSADFGVSWNVPRQLESSGDWVAVAMSPAGKNMAAALISTGVYVSSDYGTSWVLALASVFDDFTSVAMDSTGQYLIVGTFSSGVLLSNDSGASWAAVGSLPTMYPWLAATVDVTGQYMYVGSWTNGLWVSTDYGAMFTQVSNLPGEPIYITSIVISADRQHQFFVSYASGELYYSSDEGQTWGVTSGSFWSGAAMSSSGANVTIGSDGAGVGISFDYGQTISQIALTPQEWQQIVSSSTGQFAAVIVNSGGVWLSSDYGMTWSASLSAPSSVFGQSIAMSSAGDVLVASQDTQTLYISFDYGQSWSSTTAPFDGANSLDCDSTCENVVAATDDGIYLSSTYGQTWTVATTPVSGVYVVSCDDAMRIIYAAAYSGYLYSSSDRGATWNVSLAVTGSWECLRTSASGQNVVAASFGDSVGIYYSTDYGATWTLSNFDPDNYIEALAGDSAGQNLLVAGSGLWSSNDYGATWSVVPGYEYAYYNTIACASTCQIVFAAHNDESIYVSNSINSPTTSPTAPPPSAKPTFAPTVRPSPVSAFPTIGNVLFNYSFLPVETPDGYFPVVAMNASGSFIAAANGYGGIWISQDCGESFTPSNAPQGSWQAIATNYAGQYLAAAQLNGYFYLSADFGVSWSIPSQLESSGECVSIAISPAGKNMAAVFFEVGVYVSIDYGTSWTLALQSNDFQPSSLAMDGTGQFLIVGTLSSGVLLSNDSGASWAVVSGLSASSQWDAATIDVTGQYMYMGSWANGLWISTDYGATWTQVSNLPITPTGITSIVISENRQHQFFVAPGSNAVYYSSDEGQSWGVTIGGGAWNDAAMSSSGAKVTVSSGTLGIGISLDYGQTISPTMLEAQEWQQIVSSSTGQFAAVIVGNGGVWLSSDYGLNWTVSSGAPLSAYWQSIAMSSAGDVLVASQDTQTLYISFDYGQTWSSTTTPFYGAYSLDCDSTCENVVAATGDGIYLSSTYGQTWTVAFSASDIDWWVAVSCDDAMRIIYAAAHEGFLYSSSDGGATWNVSLAVTGSWQSLRTSTNGQNVVASSSYSVGIYYSTDYGATWTASTADVDYDYSVLASDSVGQNMLVVGDTFSILASKDYGATWFEVEVLSNNQLNFNVVACASTCEIAYAASDGAAIYTSNVVSVTPTFIPTLPPTMPPTYTIKPTASPTLSPTYTVYPTASPTLSPTYTVNPTASPTLSPIYTVYPTASPTLSPTYTVNPTASPTLSPIYTVYPTTEYPTIPGNSSSTQSVQSAHALSPVVNAAGASAGLSVGLGVLVGLFGVLLVFSTGRSSLDGSKSSLLSLVPSVVEFAVFGCSFVAQVFFACLTLANSDDEYLSYGIAWLVVRSLGIAGNAVLFKKVLSGIQDNSDVSLNSLWDREGWSGHSFVYSMVGLFGYMQSSLLRYWPWLATKQTERLYGFPAYWLARSCIVWDVLVMLALLALEFVFLQEDTSSQDGGWNAGTRTVVAISLVSTALLVIWYLTIFFVMMSGGSAATDAVGSANGASKDNGRGAGEDALEMRENPLTSASKVSVNKEEKTAAASVSPLHAATELPTEALPTTHTKDVQGEENA